jgi:hypothetical protein
MAPASSKDGELTGKRSETMTRTFRALIVGAILAVAFAGVASAQQKPAPSPAAIQMAKEIIALKGATSTFDPLIPGVIEYHRNILIQTNPNLSREIEQVATKLINDLQGRRVELQQSLAISYAEHFTEQELREAIAFYRTPLGKKLIIEEPKAMEDTMKAADIWSKKFADEVVVKLREEMRKRGHNVI